MKANSIRQARNDRCYVIVRLCTSHNYLKLITRRIHFYIVTEKKVYRKADCQMVVTQTKITSPLVCEIRSVRYQFHVKRGDIIVNINNDNKLEICKHIRCNSKKI